MTHQQKHSYAKNAVILTATGLLLRAAGMLFRVYIAARIGAAGMGLFQLISTVYTLAVTFATAGLQMLATRICAELSAQNKDGEQRSTVWRMTLLALFLSMASGAALYAFAPQLAVRFLANAKAAGALRVLAPSLPFMAVSAVLRGYFMAQKQVGPNAFAQMFEQAVRIGIVALLLGPAVQQGNEAACAAVMLGSTVSEGCSWVYMQVRYAGAVRRLPRRKAPPLLRRMAGILAPVAGGQYLTGVLRTAENLLIPACLATFLGRSEAALEQYGALKGMAMPVLFFPFSFIGTLATLLLPDITAAYVKHQQKTLHRLVSRVLLFTLVVSIMAGGLYTALAAQLGQVLYKSDEVGFYLRVLGPLAPLMYLESMVDGILKGLDEQVATFRYTVIDSGMRIALILVLVPRLGMKGFLFIMLVSNLLTSLLNLRRLLTVMNMRFNWMAWLVKPGVCAGAAGVFCSVLFARAAAHMPQAAALAVCGGVFCAGYAALMFLLGGIKTSDFKAEKG